MFFVFFTNLCIANCRLFLVSNIYLLTLLIIKAILCMFFSAHSGLKPSPNVIVSHPDFRMMVLANRPGFPFLGNDFFGAMGK